MYQFVITRAKCKLNLFQTKVLEGGLVPKNMYLTEGELEREGGHMTDDTIYHSVSLGKGQVNYEFRTLCLKYLKPEIVFK